MADPQISAYESFNNGSIDKAGVPMPGEANAAQPKLPEGREHIRHRPTMYIGAVDKRGLLTLLGETFVCMANELISRGHSEIGVVLHADNSIMIRESGKSTKSEAIWPIVPETSLQRLCEKIKSNGHKGDYRMGYGYESLATLNFLSKWFELTVRSHGKGQVCRWECGIHVTSLALEDLSAEDEIAIHWLPDPEIFGDAQLETTEIEGLLRKMGPMLHEATISYCNKKTAEFAVEVSRRDGVSQLAAFYSQPFDCPGEPISSFSTFTGIDGNPIELNFAIQLHNEPGINVISAANMKFTNKGGYHADAFITGLRRALQRAKYFSPNSKRFKCRPGFTAVISVRLRTPLFSGSTRSELGNDEIQKEVEDAVESAVIDHILQNESLKSAIGFV